MAIVRYHIRLSKQRTTISLDKTLSDLIALKLGFKPNTTKAHTTVRKRLEHITAPYLTYHQEWFHKPSQFVMEKIILDLVVKKLSDQYCDYNYKNTLTDDQE